METRFIPKWFTIREFADSVPQCMYHKEAEASGQDGCSAKNRGDGIQNLHVLARAELLWEEEEMPIGASVQEHEDESRWILRITADDYYKLYVNGTYAGQGPAPAWPEKYYYNEMDITSYLRKGKNVLALHLYYQGLVNRVWNSGDGRFGFACQMVKRKESEEAQAGGSAPFCPVIPEWRYEICQAYSGAVTGYDTQFLENFDSRRWQEDWKEPGFDDSSWIPAVPARWADYQCVQQPTRMLSVYSRLPDKIQKTDRGWFLDMGQEVTGALVLEAEAKEDGARAVIQCGEELEEIVQDGSRRYGGNRVRFAMRCGCRYEEIWTLRKGICRLEPYDYKAFRYAEILCGDDVQVTKIEAQIRHYPMKEDLCVLSSGSRKLDQIFQICKNGVKYGVQEGYLDCPSREKGQYLGDAVVAARSQVWLTGDTRMLRKCIDQFALTASICPGIMAVAPGSYMQEIADFSLLWLQLLWTDYQFTGDKEFLKKHWSEAEGIVKYFRRYEREDGLLENVSDKWNLVDWPENLRDSYDFPLTRPAAGEGCHNVINALYAGAVKTLAEIEAVTGRKPQYRCRWQKLKAAFIHAFYDREKQLFTDSTVSRHCALHSNIYPLYFGLCPQEARERTADFLEEKGLCCGVLTAYFYLKALAAAGRYAAVYRILVNESEHGWMNMIREGATSCFEAWGKDQKWNTSLCHPWASGPISVIIEEIAGFIPDPSQKCGYRYEPHVPEELKDTFHIKVPKVFNAFREP